MKTIKNIFKIPYLAIKSRREYNEVLTDTQKKRLDVCKSCPFNSDNKLDLSMAETMMFRINKILNFIMRVKVSNDAICTICTCNLIFKSSQEDPENMCPKNKWNNL
jgi:hypothetical protein